MTYSQPYSLPLIFIYNFSNLIGIFLADKEIIALLWKN